MYQSKPDATGRTRKFRFPESRIQFDNIVGVPDLKSRLKMQENLFQTVKINDLYNIAEVKSQTKNRIVAICKICQKQASRLIWSKKIGQEAYKIKLFNNSHEHAILRKQIHKQIISLLSNSYAKLPINEIEDYCIKKFQITSEEFKSIKKFMVKKMYEKTFVDDLEEFRKNHYLAIEPEKINIDTQTGSVVDFPEYLYASSKKMVRNLSLYGRVIYLHRYPFLIKKTSKNSDYFLLVVSGVNQFSNIIFYGFAIISSMKPSFITYTLMNLFHHTHHSICESIFTENQQFFNEGVDKFKKQTGCKAEHFWDLLVQMKEQSQPKKQKFRQALMSTSYKELQNAINQYQKLVSDDSLKFEVFRKKAPKYCLSEIPPVFIGLTPPLSHCSDILKAILQTFPKQVEYNRFFFKFFEFANANKVERHPEELVQSVQMPLLADCLQKIPVEPYNHILNNLISALDVNVTSKLSRNQLKLDDYEISITEQQGQSSDGPPQSRLFQKQSVSYEEIQLRCTCNIKLKTGIPCSHIIRACLHMEIPISTQIHGFWKVQSQLDQDGLTDEDRQTDGNGEQQGEDGAGPRAVGGRIQV